MAELTICKHNTDGLGRCDLTGEYCVEAPCHCYKPVEYAPVVHGRWMLEAHREKVNFRWNATAECSECCDEVKEIWAGFFPGVPDYLAKGIALDDAAQVELSNYCPNCGAKMDLEVDDG